MPARCEWEGEVVISAVPSSAHQARQLLREKIEIIVTGWVKRRDGSIASEESPHSWFKRNLYRLFSAYINAGHAELFMDLAKRSTRSLVGLRAIEDNPFKVALFAMWNDNESLGRHRQRVFGTQMLYAYLHAVAPEHLIGFIRASGSPQTIANKLRSGEREPGFDI